MKRLLSLTVALGLISATAEAKPFKRAVVIAGGGVTVATSIGIIAGLKSRGWEPDVVLTSCGASIGGAIYNSYPDPEDALEFAKGPVMHDIFRQTKIGVPNLLRVKKIFDKLADAVGIPEVFFPSILTLPEQLPQLFPIRRFQNHRGPRLIMVGARAEFGPDDVGEITRDRFTEVMFTDSDTARYVDGFPSVRASFPEAFIRRRVEAISNSSLEQGARASMSDPFLINPAKIRGEYYFTGAADLHPVELAQSLADEVIVTFPDGIYTEFEDLVVSKSFGYSPRKRALQITTFRDVKWIDIDGLKKTNFDPTPNIFLGLTNHIPKSLTKYAKGVQKQYDFGFTRAVEAIDLQRNRKNVRSHLRQPIDPRLYRDFSCKYARVWKTARRGGCRDDRWAGCNRQKEARTCTPIR